jgi:hypothetical protein
MKGGGAAIPLDSITISTRTAEGIGLALQQDFYPIETPERMAWVVLVLRQIEDRSEWFPCGKWATIQHIERQLGYCAESAANRLY